MSGASSGRTLVRGGHPGAGSGGDRPAQARATRQLHPRAILPRAILPRAILGIVLAGALALAASGSARAQAIDLSHGGPITVTSRDGIDWNQGEQVVIARGDARAVRGDVTVTADVLIAHYRPKATPAGAPKPAAPAPGAVPGAAGAADDTGANEIYRLEAVGNVHIFTPTDQAWGDHAIYDIDQAVLLMTGHALKLVTPTDVMTARDALEYWSQRHMSVGRGDAVVTTNDGRRVQADVLVGYSLDPAAPPAAGAPPRAQTVAVKPGADPLTSGGKLQRVDAFGHVRVQTPSEIVTGDRGVYIPDTGIARIVGDVHITRGENQMNGQAAIVNMHTGLATLSELPGSRVEGLIVPNSSAPAAAAAPGAAAPRPARPARPPAP